MSKDNKSSTKQIHLYTCFKNRNIIIHESQDRRNSAEICDKDQAIRDRFHAGKGVLCVKKLNRYLLPNVTDTSILLGSENTRDGIRLSGLMPASLVNEN